jgi:hypothetical protein
MRRVAIRRIDVMGHVNHVVQLGWQADVVYLELPLIATAYNAITFCTPRRLTAGDCADQSITYELAGC